MTNQKNYHEKPNPPAPERHPGSGSLPFSIFSVLASILFVLYGLYILVTIDGPGILMAFAVVAIIYGLLGLAILASAYKFHAPWSITAMVVSAVCCLVIYVLALSSGVLSGVYLSGFFLLALALWLNWLAVVKVVKGGKVKA